MIKLLLKYVFCASFGGDSHDDVQKFDGKEEEEGSCPHKKFMWLETLNPSAKCMHCGLCYFPDEQRWMK